MPRNEKTDVELIRTWTLPPAATMGSSVRAKGIQQEIQARLTVASKKSISLEGTDLTLAMPASAKTAFDAAAAVISKAMEETKTLPVIPREIQDILNIKTSERRRWLADGRLPSAGTRTVRLSGRARQITFHIFDPKIVEDFLNRGVVDEWRVDDAQATAEKRRKSASRAKLIRARRNKLKSDKKTTRSVDAMAIELPGWEEFDRDGFLQ